ncbi:hypothetical protein MNBD_BACTEROID02-304 [hydrothermal vent metagenome]|uniref:Uncharacterized protein n=1 Tax=hydrothermal vent metagenome TaxID=652676 RepID=A0A3B0RFD5_9ZZZZ
MKKTILLFIFILASFNFCLAQEWFTSLKVAKKLALVQDKMLFVMWENATSYPYPVLINTEKGESIVTDLFKDERINKLIWDYFVPVTIYESQYAELSQQIKETRGTKYFNKFIDDSIKIMDVNGNILNVNTSYETVENLFLLIQRYALNTAFLKQELVNYSKNKNLTTAFSLASKYLDFAVFAEKDQRLEIIQLANIYFNESKSYLAKSGLKNIKGFLQNCDLQIIKEYLILNKPRKALRYLKKLDIADIDNLNLSLFSSLNYAGFKLLMNEKKAALWKSKISLVDLSKANLIINNNF